MSVVAALLAAIAAWLAIGPRAGLRRLAAAPIVRKGHRRARAAALVAAGSGLLLCAGLFGGRPEVVLGLAGAGLAVTVWFVGHRAVRQKRALGAMGRVAEACSLVASLVRVGHVPPVALRLAAVECPVLAPVAAVQAVGGDVAAALHREATKPGHAGLARVAQAWEVAERTGAPLVGALESVGEMLAGDQRLANTIAGELAAPRATSRLLAVLPLVGLGLGFAMGGNPISFLLSGIAGQICFVAGIWLACVGVVWSDILASRAAGTHAPSGRSAGRADEASAS